MKINTKVTVLMSVICLGVLAVAGISFGIGHSLGGPSIASVREQLRQELAEIREQEKQDRDQQRAQAWAASAERLRSNGATAGDLILCQDSFISWVYLVCEPRGMGPAALVNDGQGPGFWEGETFGRVIKKDQNPELYANLLTKLTEQVRTAQNGV